MDKTGGEQMKTWKILTIAFAAVIAVSLTVTTLAYFIWTTTPQSPYNYHMGPSTTTAQRSQVSPRMDSAQKPYTTSDPEDTSPEQTIPETPQLTTQEPPVLYTPQQFQSRGPQYGGYGWPGGCMGRGYFGSTTYSDTQTTELTIDQAAQIAQAYVASLDNPDLLVEEVEEFTANFYVLVKEKSTDNGAFELLIDKYTGVVTPEMGPNMMWNTKYSFNSGYCNWFRETPTTSTITVEQARANAQQYLDEYYPGTTADEVTVFYGYYTFEVLSSSGVYGMLSVNSHTGQVWFHTWHGTFIQEITTA